MDGIPGGIDSRYLVGHELDRAKHPGNRDGPPVAQDSELARKPHPTEMMQQSERQHRDIELDPGEPRRSHRQAEGFKPAHARPRNSTYQNTFRNVRLMRSDPVSGCSASLSGATP